MTTWLEPSMLLEVHCNCGQKLDVTDITFNPQGATVTVYVDACDTCLNEAFKDGQSDDQL